MLALRGKTNGVSAITRRTVENSQPYYKKFKGFTSQKRLQVQFLDRQCKGFFFLAAAVQRWLGTLDWSSWSMCDAYDGVYESVTAASAAG